MVSLLLGKIEECLCAAWGFYSAQLSQLLNSVCTCSYPDRSTQKLPLNGCALPAAPSLGIEAQCREHVPAQISHSARIPCLEVGGEISISWAAAAPLGPADRAPWSCSPSSQMLPAL